jgi:hypothetical protein
MLFWNICHFAETVSRLQTRRSLSKVSRVSSRTFFRGSSRDAGGPIVSSGKEDHHLNRCDDTTMMNRSLFLALIVLGISTSSFSQSTRRDGSSPAPSQSNLYLQALKVYVDTTYHSYGYIVDTSMNWFNRVFEADRGIRNLTPRQVGSCAIRWMEEESTLQRELKAHNKTIPLTRIWPMENSGDTLVISFTDYRFSITGGHPYYALEGGCHIRFVYDCVKKEFVVAKVELWGV